MFVTSKRCFVNCLAQFMDYEQLTNANYYVIDVSAGGNRVKFDKEVVYNSDGSSYIKEKPVINNMPSITKFHVVLSEGWLDPSVAIINTIDNNQRISQLTNMDNLKIFQEYLKRPDVIGNVYDWFYGNSQNAPRGNGLMIVVINTEEHVRVFGHTICEFLSQYLGEDIEFVDAQMRPEWVPGYPRYKGNKEFAERILRDQRDYQLLEEFKSGISFHNIENITAIVNCMSPQKLMHLYELLFPDQPLPPGNYTTDHIKKIIIGKTMDMMPEQSKIPNLHTSNAYLESLDAEINRLNGY